MTNYFEERRSYTKIFKNLLILKDTNERLFNEVSDYFNRSIKCELGTEPAAVRLLTGKSFVMRLISIEEDSLVFEKVNGHVRVVPFSKIESLREGLYA